MKTELKKLQRFKSYGQKKFTLKLGPFSFVFWPEISTSLRDPLGCSDLSQIFFGSSLIATEWDKIVAEIIHKTFVFLHRISMSLRDPLGCSDFGSSPIATEWDKIVAEIIFGIP